MKLITSLLLSGLAVSTAFSEPAATDPLYELGKTKFEQICIACHKYERGPAMIAPPAFAIQMHYNDTFGDDEAGFRKAVVQWVKTPDKEKTLMPGAVRKFNLMPPLPLPDADLDAIAAYLFRADFNGECDPAEMQRNKQLAN